MADYFRRLFELRRRKPGDDLTTHLVQVDENGDILTNEELTAKVILLFGAGHEATVNLMGNRLLDAVPVQRPSEPVVTSDNSHPWAETVKAGSDSWNNLQSVATKTQQSFYFNTLSSSAEFLRQDDQKWTLSNAIDALCLHRSAPSYWQHLLCAHFFQSPHTPSSFLGHITGLRGADTLRSTTNINTGIQSLNRRRRLSLRTPRRVHSRSSSPSQISSSRFMTMAG
jgi:hypothetical protein